MVLNVDFFRSWLRQVFSVNSLMIILIKQATFSFLCYVNNLLSSAKKQFQLRHKLNAKKPVKYSSKYSDKEPLS